MTAIDPRQIKQDGATDGQGLVWDDGENRWRPESPAAAPVKASGSEVRTGADDAKFVTGKSLYDAAALVTLTDGATVAVDLAAGINFVLTLGGNRTLGAPSNAKPGESGVIIVKQDATGSRTLAYNTAWKFFGGAPTLSTAANAVDVISYVVEASGLVRCGIGKASA